MNATIQGAQARRGRRPQPLPAWAALLGAVVLLGLAGCSSPGPGRPVAVVTIAPGASPVTEGTAVQFTVQVAPAPAAELAVSVTVTDAGARLAAAAPQTVTIPAGASAATLTLPTTADAEAEPDSAVTATVAAGTGYAPGTPSAATVTVTDAAPPPSMPVPVVTIAAVASAVAEGAAVVFALTAAPAPAAELAVSVTVTESGAMLAQPGPRQVTFAAGAGSATLTMDTVDDAEAEPDSTVTATVTAGSGYTPGAGMATASVRVTDAGQPQPLPLPVVTLAAVVDQVTEGTPARFTVSADRAPAADLAVNVAVTGGAGMLSGVPPASVTIRAGAAAAALTLETDDDTEVEAASTVTVSLQPGSGYEVGVPGSAGVRVVDDDRVPLVPLFFSYVEFDEPDDRVDTNDPPRRTPESAWPARSLGLPFGADFVNATGDPPAGASAAHRNCVAIAAPMEPIALERWLALGGTGRTHDVTVLPAAADGMDGVEYAAPGHGFTLSTDAAGATWLAGRPNLAAGDYQWRLNARDAAGQHEYRTWKLTVTPRAYLSLEGLDIVAGHADLAAGAVENPDPNDPTVSLPADQPTTDWADFISSRFDPDAATAASQTGFEAVGGIGVSLNLADGATAAASVWGNLVADRERSGVADVDVLWVGALTPDAVLKVKVEGTSERATGIFNRAAVELRPHLPGTTGEQPAVMPAAPADADGFVTYRDLDCGNYYLKVTGVMEEPGHYRLSWTFPGS